MPSKIVLEKKKKKVKEFADLMGKNGVFFFDYRGMTVGEFEQLRNTVKNLDGNIKVIKNRIAKRYFMEQEEKFDEELLKGPNAILYTDEKYIEAARALVEFNKEKKIIKIRSAYVERQYIDNKKVIEIASLPGKKQMLSQLVFSIAMPLKKFGSTLSAPLKNILILMNNLKDKKEKEEAKNG